METLVYGDDRVARHVVVDILQRQGLAHRVVESLSGLPEVALLLLTTPRLQDVDWGVVRSFLRRGGRVAFLLPESHALSLLGREEAVHYPFPYLMATGGPYTHLQVLSPPRLVRQAAGQALAHFCLDFSTTARSWKTRYPALAAGHEGRGAWGAFLYDLPRTILAFHQGHPVFAGDGDLPDPIGDGRHRATHLLHRQVHPALAEVPQAQGHEMLLLRLLRRLCEGVSPLPRLWPLPAQDTAAVVLSGDSDLLAAESLHLALDRLVQWHLPYTLYTMPEDLKKLSGDDLSRYRREGIDFALHYYHGPTPTSAEMQQGLRDDVATFAAAGLTPTSARGHSVIWTGWSEQAQLLHEVGIAASSNFLGRLTYAAGTGLPYRFLSEGGDLLDTLELPMYAGDDVTLADKWGAPPLPAMAALHRTLAALESAAALYHEVLTFIFHPHYFSGIEPATNEWIRGLGTACAERGYPVYSVGRWLDFWAARTAINLSHQAAAANVALQLSSASEDIGVALPRTWCGKTLQNAGKSAGGSGELVLPAAASMEIEYV